ncbi:hypothetical protein SteCoe_29396 [Stentor coeruleus]|uniref:Dickkopf N-terminal cysteine-rich domain-containing protein n=1 Tax=Stentor coeruleus TaxID=5963 RepID=A0A1R2B616_9CILI|nr:hypothetical protein SteCoe_29396 [Stentor coeruleus]
MFVLFLLSTVHASLNCPKYTCKTDSQAFNPETCVYYKNSTNTYYAHECSKSSNHTYCDVTNNANSTCITKPVIGRLPGETCNVNITCASPGRCEYNKCTSGIKDSNCTDNLDCGVGLYCKTEGGISTCQDLIKAWDLVNLCTNDFQCQLNSSCNGTATKPGICIGYFNITRYEWVATCENFQNLLCETGYCVNDTKGIDNSNYKCFGDAQNNRAKPYTCKHEDCRSFEDKNLESQYIPGDCICGYNDERVGVCNLFNQDEKAQSYFTLLNNWLTGEKISRCHTNARFTASFTCMKDVGWSDADELIYKYYKITQYPYRYFAKDCVYETMLQEYKEFKDIYDWAVSLMVSGVVISLF